MVLFMGLLRDSNKARMVKTLLKSWVPFKKKIFYVYETNVEILVEVLNSQLFEYWLRESHLGWEKRQDR